MRFRDVDYLMRRRPFTPLRFVMTDGAAYLVRRPDHGRANRSFVEVTSPSATADTNLSEYLSLLHIIRIEELPPPPPAAPPMNGPTT